MVYSPKCRESWMINFYDTSVKIANNYLLELHELNCAAVIPTEYSTEFYATHPLRIPIVN